MATVTGYTAARMKEIEDKAIVDGEVVSGNLILRPKNYPTEPAINAGPVIGPAGPTGPAGAVSELDLDTAIADLDTKLGNPLGVMNRKTTAQLIPYSTTGTHYLVSFGDEDTWDNGAFHTNTDLRKFVVPAGGAGIYSVTYNAVLFSTIGAAGGTRFISIQKNSLGNDSGRVAVNQFDAPVGFTHVTLSIQDHFRLNAGDYLCASVYNYVHLAETAPNATTINLTGNFCMRWVAQ